MIRFQRILCPTDFSAASLRAVPYALELARLFDAEVYFIHVVQALPTVPADFGFETEVVEYAAAIRHSAEEQLAALTAREAEDIRSPRLLVQGNPAEAILAAADQYGIDLIAIATHGTTGWRHLLFGSVAEKVVRLAKVQVLSVSAREGTSAEPTAAAPGGVAQREARTMSYVATPEVGILDVGGTRVEVPWLEALLDEFEVGGWEPGDAGLEQALVRAERALGRPIPEGSTDLWAAALVDAFTRYHAARRSATEPPADPGTDESVG